MTSTGFFTSVSSEPYRTQVHGFAGAPTIAPLDANSMVDIPIQKKRELFRAQLTLSPVSSACVTASKFPMVSCRSVKPASL